MSDRFLVFKTKSSEKDFGFMFAVLPTFANTMKLLLINLIFIVFLQQNIFTISLMWIVFILKLFFEVIFRKWELGERGSDLKIIAFGRVVIQSGCLFEPGQWSN